jgi:hypothetical protein
MIPRLEARFRSRCSWAIFVLSCVAFVSLGHAQQGTASGGIAPDSPPATPLPFPRHAVAGLDLRHLSSLAALQWLTDANVSDLPLIAIPIDGDVVAALASADVQDAAVAALDKMVQAGGASPLVACLHEPPHVEDRQHVALVAVEALIERYPGAVAYVTGCGDTTDHTWLQALSRAMSQINRWAEPTPEPLIPVAGGAPLTDLSLDDSSMLTDLSTAPLSGSYSLVSVPIATPVTWDVVEAAQQAIVDSPRVALVMFRPDQASVPADVSAVFAVAPLASGQLPEGFSNAAAPFILQEGDWQQSQVGTVRYLRSSAETATLVLDFVGTDIYLLAVRSPESGQVSAWIDPIVTGDATPPDVTIDLAAPQARDAVRPLFQGLPATRHRLYVMVHNSGDTSVMVSGFYVVGRLTPAWTGLLAAGGLLTLATVTLAERSYASVVAIRSSARPGVGARQREHPRGFSRRD